MTPETNESAEPSGRPGAAMSAEMSVENKVFAPTRVRSLSTGGVFLEMEDRPPVGAEVDIGLRISLEDRETTEIEARGRISGHDPDGVQVEFVKILTPGGDRRLRDLVPPETEQP